jgi:hypothetical protein
VTACAQRYGTRIAAYEIWNEPNYRSSSTVGTWFGTTAQLVSLAQAAYNAITGVSNSIKVISPSYFSESDGALYTNGPDSLDAYLAAGGGAYCDAVGYHFYLAYNRDWTYLPTYVSTVQSKLTARSVSKPIWNTEFGNQEIYTLNGQRAMSWLDRELFMARSQIMVAVAGLARSAWYRYDGSTYDGSGRSYSMVDNAPERPASSAAGTTFTAKSPGARSPV